jgi:AraC-like DNA-binding protein
MAKEPFFAPQVAGSRRIYLGVAPGLPLAVVGCGQEEWAARYEVRRSGFPHAIVEFVARGRGELDLAGAVHPLAPGSVFVYGPRVAHRIRAGERGMTKYFAALGGREVGAELARQGMPPGRAFHVADPAKVREIFADLIDHAFGDHPERAKSCAVAAGYLLMKVGDLALAPGELQTPAFATYQRCRAHIEAHFAELPSLRAVAEACHVDEAYLCRLFRRFGRESPYTFLQRLRIGRAADWIQSGRATAKQAAEACGFSEPSSFSRAMKRVLGVRPSAL